MFHSFYRYDRPYIMAWERIHESASCRAFYRLRRKGCTLFAFETDRASFEFEYFSGLCDVE